jgi:hypothetical protein
VIARLAIFAFALAAGAAAAQDPGLQERSALLEALYRAALLHSGDKEALQADQRRWQESTRAQCAASECLGVAYGRRIVEMEARLRAATRPSEEPVDKGNVEAVCARITALADAQSLGRHALPEVPLSILEEEDPDSAYFDGRLLSDVFQEIGKDDIVQPPDSVSRLRLSGERPAAPFVNVFTGGSCPAAQTWNVELADAAATAGRNPFVLLPVDDPDKDLEDLWYGASDYPVFVDGRHFVVTVAYGHPNLLSLVSWIRPDGLRAPICKVAHSTARAVESTTKDSPCLAIANGKARAAKWKAAAGDVVEEVAIATLDIDIDRDGSVESVARFSHNSGAGCGSHREWLRAVDARKKPVVKGWLAEALAKIAPNEQVFIWRVAGATYVESYHSRTGGVVYSVSKAGAKEVCRMVAKPSNTVMRYFHTIAIPLTR